MLIAIQLTLVSDKPGILPPYLGRANYAATLARLHEVDPALAQAVHDSSGPKPLTCSGLMNARAHRQGVAIEAAKPYFVRITGLTQEVSRALDAALLAETPRVWELDRHVFHVQQAVCDAAANPWTGRAAYAELAAQPRLFGGGMPRQVSLHFASPAAFKSGGVTVPIPLPGLVFGSLVDRWNAFSSITLSAEVRRFGEEMVAVSRYKLQSRPVAQKNQGLRMGGVGDVTYAALGGDRYWLGALHMLADFALYSGVGVQTAAGMGQTRRIG